MALRDLIRDCGQSARLMDPATVEALKRFAQKTSDTESEQASASESAPEPAQPEAVADNDKTASSAPE